jgi:class 3 adenylate cyclase
MHTSKPQVNHLSSEIGDAECRFGRFHYLNLLANLLGIFTMAALNFLTPLGFIKAQKEYIFGEGGWMVLGSLWPLVLILTTLLHHRLTKPLRRPGRTISATSKAIPEISERALRRILNLPVAAALVNLAVWGLVAAVVVAYFRIYRDISLFHSLFLFFRSFMIGMVAAGLSFFLLENHLRTRWIPLFFPAGKLTAVRGAVRIPIMRRIRALWGAGTLNPMIILVGTLFFTWFEVRENPVPVEELSTGILHFTVVLCILFVAIALGLNFLVEKSIRWPVREMLRAVKAVGSGDFSHRVQVVSNDEIGILGDAGNEMIAGLAERERIRETFGLYVTREIRDRILAGLIPADGERTTATVLFSDLRDFTPYVEENSPEEVVKSMRSYFTAMQQAIVSRQGIVLQYVGDGIEASFGAPIPCESHAEEAVIAALKMRAALEELNRLRMERGQAVFRHGIGIHTGLVLAGNTGSRDHLSYALIGETVNVAARIQDLTKQFRWDILISEETATLLKGTFQLRREEPVIVKGYSRPVTLFRVIG